MISVTSSLTAIVFLSGLNKQTSPNPHDNGADHFRLESTTFTYLICFLFLKRKGTTVVDSNSKVLMWCKFEIL